MFELLTHNEFSLTKTVIVLLAVAILASWDLMQRIKNRNAHYLFACILGTILSAGFIGFTDLLFTSAPKTDGFLMAFGLLLILIAWRLLFGPWETETKATILGSFVFWITLHILWNEPTETRFAHITAIGVALLPAVVWCALFLGYHRERLSRVFLMFFAGMLSTAPILFYDVLVRRGIEMHFFLFKIVPESFGNNTERFMAVQFPGVTGVPRTLLSVFLSFLIVGLIEELSKYWVLRKSGQKVFASIDDVMQLAIIVAIGFAFAENIANQGYFLSFVREYLLSSERDIAGFFGNVIGRSVLTSMVHIVSTGVMGYFLGLAIFAGPYLEERRARGVTPSTATYIAGLLRLRTKSVFQVQMLTCGFVAAIVLHALYNFLVTLPDILPGNPRTFGDLFQLSSESFLQYLSILVVPALLYVVGGFWLLTMLFARKENIKIRENIISSDSFVTTEEAA